MLSSRTSEGGGLLQRLYSMFPNGWPGAGILVLRVVGGSIPIYDCIPPMLGAPHRAPLAILLLGALASVFFLVGFWTPFAGILLAIAESSGVVLGREHVHSAVLLAAVGVSVAMLGPGVWSIDALRFGRRRVQIRES